MVKHSFDTKSATKLADAELFTAMLYNVASGVASPVVRMADCDFHC